MTTGIKIPLICVAHTVYSDALIRCAYGAGPTEFTMTIPKGTYVMDDVYNGLASSIDATDLLHRMAYLFDQQTGGNPTRPLYDRGVLGSGAYSAWVAAWEDNGPGTLCYVSPKASDGTNEEGRRILRRLGTDGVNGSVFTVDGIETADGTPKFHIPVAGIWSPGQGEAQLDAEPETGRGSVSLSGSGKAYGYSLGEGRKERRIMLNSVPANRIWDRDPSSVASLKRQLWPWLQKANPFRYYANAAAVRTYITEDVSTEDDGFDLKSVVGLSVGDWCWLNGEKMRIKSISAPEVIFFRPEPVAHSKYDPISNDECSTFVLAPDGGTISLKGFPPEPVNYNVDRWSFSIAGWRTT